jgi:plastocyanin
MKKSILLLIFNLAISAGLFAESYNINISGFTYSPDLLTVNVGDNVTIMGSTMHPLVQVSKATWLANSNTPMTGGWGTQTSDYTLNATVADTIYFVCSAHVSLGMKGRIIVHAVAGINEVNQNMQGFFIFPNPVSQTANLVLNIPGDNNFTLQLFNSAGKKMNENIISRADISGGSGFSIDVSDLANGIYIIEITGGHELYSQRMIVMK